MPKLPNIETINNSFNVVMAPSGTAKTQAPMAGHR